MPPESRSDVPASVLRYVARTRQTVLLDDASTDSNFAGLKARSVLCVPLVRGSELVGVLYLENNLATAAFTPARVALLEALSSQIAISAENAALYEDMRGQADAFARFVPREFLTFLGHETIEQVRLGDAVAKEMAVLFSDIRDFTTLSEQLTPDQNFEFLNAYLGRVGPVIRANRGFVDKYIGDAVMALFPRSPDDALRAAVAMQQQAATLDPVGGRRVTMGVGLHIGNLILGVLGESERMEGTVISDAVNIGARLEGLTKKYGVGIIASKAMIQGCTEPERFPHRCLGDEVVKGKAEPVRIYEVFAGDPQDVLEKKLRTRGNFEEAVTALSTGNAADAFVLLRSVQSELPDDPVTKQLMARAAKAVTGAYTPT
ncbi:MAG: GAF domain-containing protein [Proteobacteria bacterium]|nr:GAF domain-containing protein [Pseudomonadota bacterium]